MYGASDLIILNLGSCQFRIENCHHRQSLSRKFSSINLTHKIG